MIILLLHIHVWSIRTNYHSLLKLVVSKICEDLTHRVKENMIVIGKEMDFFMVVSIDCYNLQR